MTRHQQYYAFEDHYAEVSQTHYKAESAERYRAFKDTPGEFFKHVNERVTEEVARARDIMHPGSHNRIREATERALLDGRLQWLAKGSEWHSLFGDHR
jgi:cullin 4